MTFGYLEIDQFMSKLVWISFRQLLETLGQILKPVGHTVSSMQFGVCQARIGYTVMMLQQKFAYL